MSSPQRRRELQDQFDRQCEERAREEARKAELPMYLRIEEAFISNDLKDILHRLANGEHE